MRTLLVCRLMRVMALHYHNTLDVAQIPQMVELNIGHSIIARAVLDGLDKAVRDMREILDKAR